MSYSQINDSSENPRGEFLKTKLSKKPSNLRIPMKDKIPRID